MNFTFQEKHQTQTFQWHTYQHILSDPLEYNFSSLDLKCWSNKTSSHFLIKFPVGKVEEKYQWAPLKWELAQSPTNRSIDPIFTGLVIAKLFSTNPSNNKQQVLKSLVVVCYQGIYNQLLYEKVDCYYSSKCIYVFCCLACSTREHTTYSNRTKWKCWAAAAGYYFF